MHGSKYFNKLLLNCKHIVTIELFDLLNYQLFAIKHPVALHMGINE